MSAAHDGARCDQQVWGTVASGPKVTPADSNVEPLPVQTAIRGAQSNQSWHR
jgi:hypothetical protein